MYNVLSRNQFALLMSNKLELGKFSVLTGNKYPV